MIVISPILVIIATSNVLGKQYLLPTNQQKVFTLSILAGAGVNLILNLILIHYWNAAGASIATVIAEIVVTAVQCWFTRKQLPLGECLLSGLRYAVFGSVMFLAVRGVGLALPAGRIWALIIMVAVGVIVYLGELLVMKDPMVKMGFELIKGRKRV